MFLNEFFYINFQAWQLLQVLNICVENSFFTYVCLENARQLFLFIYWLKTYEAFNYQQAL